MFRPQVFRIGKCKSRLGAETPDVAHTLQTLVRHPFGHQQIQLRFGQRYLDIGLVYLHFVIPKRIFLDPFVAYGVQDKVFQAAQQIHGSVILAVMCRLHEGIETVDILVRNHIERQILFTVLLTDVLFHIAQQTVVFVGCKLRDTHSDLFLTLVAIFGELREEHAGIADLTAQALFNGKTVRLFVLFDQQIVCCEDIGAERADDFVDLQRYGIAGQRPFGLLIQFFRLDLALGIYFCRNAAGSDADVNGGFPFFVQFGFLTEENNAESRSVGHGCKNLIS